MDEQMTSDHAVPGWFYAVAAVALLFEAFGCFMYVTQVTADHAALALDQRAMWDATPTWMVAAFAIAVWVGLAGAVLLLMRRKLAVPVLLVSLVAVIVQFTWWVFLSGAAETLGPSTYAAPAVVILVGILLVWLASIGVKRGWLR